jgi:hypothetical protein
MNVYVVFLMKDFGAVNAGWVAVGPTPATAGGFPMRGSRGQ